MRDTESKLGAELRIILARHRVLESALLDTLKSLPREDAVRLAERAAQLANDDPATIPPLCGPEIRPWSFLKKDAR